MTTAARFEAPAAQVENRRAIRAFAAALDTEGRDATHQEMEEWCGVAGLDVVCRTFDVDDFSAYYLTQLDRVQVPFQPFNQVNAKRWRLTTHGNGNLYA